MPIEPEKINEIARKFGTSLMDVGIKMIQSAYTNLKPTKVTFSFIQNAVTNAGLTTPIVQLDSNYFVTNWGQWEIIKDTSLVDKMIYYNEQFDCDNFSYLFSSLAALLFKLNSCGATYGAVYDNKTKVLIAYHYFNLIVTDDGKLYCYESMNDGWCLVEKGKPIIINEWEYRPLKVYYY